MFIDDMGATGAFVKQLFEDAVKHGAGTLTLDLNGLGEIGDDGISIGPHPGFNPTSFVMSLRSENGGRGDQWAFAADDVNEVRQFIKALQGWVSFIDDSNKP